MKMARGDAPGGGGGTVSHRVWSMPKGITSTLLSHPTSSDDRARCARLGTTTAAAQEAGDVRERMGMVDVDDVGALPGGGDVARRDLLRAQRREGERMGDRRTVAAGDPGLA